jgi:beta-phosphoglucomutase family hydrolase
VYGLPRAIVACLFDLDGVLTETARLHVEAWQRTFDGFLRDRAGHAGGRFRPFDPVTDYEAYVDGKPRSDGVRDFLASRAIRLPEGQPRDGASLATVRGLGNRKNRLFRRLLRERGVETYPGSLRYLRQVRASGLRTAVVSASANCRTVLQAAGIEELFEARIDGRTLSRRHLHGKPAPDSYLAAAAALDVRPANAAVFEDAPSGITAGRAGGFGFLVGLDRRGEGRELRLAGADVVVTDLSGLLT